MAELEKQAYSIAHAAEVLDSSVDLIRRGIRRGEIRSVKLLGKTLVPVVEVRRILGLDTEPPSPRELLELAAKLAGGGGEAG